MSPISPVEEQDTPALSQIIGDCDLTVSHSPSDYRWKLLVVLQTHVLFLLNGGQVINTKEPGAVYIR